MVSRRRRRRPTGTAPGFVCTNNSARKWEGKFSSIVAAAYKLHLGDKKNKRKKEAYKHKISKPMLGVPTSGRNVTGTVLDFNQVLSIRTLLRTVRKEKG